MTLLRHAPLLIALTSLWAFTGCGSSSKSDSTDAGVQAGVQAGDQTTIAELKPSVYILPDDVAAEVIVEPGVLRFARSSGMPTLHAGDVVVSSYGTGFIRKIVREPTLSPTSAPVGGQRLQGVGDDVMQSVETLIGSLTDVFLNLDFQQSIKAKLIDENLSGTYLQGDQAIGIQLSRAEVSLTPQVTLRLVIKEGHLDTVSTKIEVSSKVAEAVEEHANAAWQWTGKKHLYDWPSIALKFTVGPVPVVSTLKLSLDANASAEASGHFSVEVGRECSGSVTETASWSKAKNWTTDYANEIKCAFIGPHGTLDANVKATGGLSLSGTWAFYETGSVTLDLSPSVTVEGELCPAPGEWRAKAELSAGISAALAPLGVSVAQLPRTELFRISDPLFSTAAGVAEGVCCLGDACGSQGGAGGQSGNGSGGAGGGGTTGTSGAGGISGVGGNAGTAGSAGTDGTTSCGPDNRYHVTVTSSWDDVVTDTQTGQTWHRTNERVSGLPTCTVGGENDGWGGHDDPFCCKTGGTDPTYAKCNWEGAQQLCGNAGMRLPTLDELLEIALVTGTCGGSVQSDLESCPSVCVLSWESWSATSASDLGAYYVKSNLAPVGLGTTTAGKKSPYGIFGVRCVKDPMN